MKEMEGIILIESGTRPNELNSCSVSASVLPSGRYVPRKAAKQSHWISTQQTLCVLVQL